MIILSGTGVDRVYSGCEKTLALWFVRTNHALDDMGLDPYNKPSPRVRIAASYNNKSTIKQ